MPGNKYVSCPNHVGSPNHIPGRVERLLRDRELRKNNRTSHSSEFNDNISRLNESYEHELRVREGENGHARQYSEGPENERLHLEGRERVDGRPCRQRLLVVANRLPVSAVRRGEDSWSLEISAGGLVSALLGKWWLWYCIGSIYYLFIGVLHTHWVHLEPTTWPGWFPKWQLYFLFLVCFFVSLPFQLQRGS